MSDEKIKEITKDERKAILDVIEVFIKNNLRTIDRKVYFTKNSLAQRLKNSCPIDIRYAFEPRRDDDDYVEGLITEEEAYNKVIYDLKEKGELEEILINEDANSKELTSAFRLK